MANRLLGKLTLVKNSYSETDPSLIIAACCYVATKAEEKLLIHIKIVIQKASHVCVYASTYQAPHGPNHRGFIRTRGAKFQNERRRKAHPKTLNLEERRRKRKENVVEEALSCV
ncbi:hypothetical protein K435DRAFT_808198 [Dendrothele bispora CBS 962.96]|uniref:Uncharacterized protein n=1 Tax=Dendrothele bispora (strain CBS 962.96) TaxID=1314807 RepID=A0A4V4HCA5_DENBC|nr:hypothetical protein K435DRAFT_808198 [Dendrothele bispora CBS 962.96]